MNNEPSSAAQPVTGWRFRLGATLFVLSIVVPIAGIPLVTTLGLSATMTTSISAGLIAAAEVLGIVAIAVMGKPGYQYIKTLVLGLLKKYGPPREVSRLRYNIGLVMFVLPVLFGWLSIYVADYIPAFGEYQLVYAISGDVLLLSSLFVLGGDFWDKIQALFVHSAKVCSAATRQVG